MRIRVSSLRREMINEGRDDHMSLLAAAKCPVLVIIFTVAFSILQAMPDEVESAKDMLVVAQTLMDEERYEEAETYCRMAIEENPKLYPAYNIMGVISSKRPGYEHKAISYLNNSLAIRHDQPEVYAVLALIYNNLSDTEQSINCLKEGLKYSPDDFKLNFNLGFTYFFVIQDPYRAIAYLKKAEKSNPYYDKVIYMLGVAYLITNKVPQAVESINRLRAMRSEYLAAQLERFFRQARGNESLNMREVMTDFVNSAQVNASEKKEAPPKVKIGERNMTFTPSGTATASGTGKITVKTSYSSGKGVKEEAGYSQAGLSE
ncbi:MAG: hypothetical protein ABH885_07405 [Candidatus Omnitrophota bacterium]